MISRVSVCIWGSDALERQIGPIAAISDLSRSSAKCEDSFTLAEDQGRSQLGNNVGNIGVST